MSGALAVAGLLVGAGAIFWGSELFAEHLRPAAAVLGVSTFALALLLAGAEPEELAAAVTASIRHAPGIALGDAVGANVTGLLVAVGLVAAMIPVAFNRGLRRHAGLCLLAGAIAAAVAWGGRVNRWEGALLVAVYACYVGYVWTVERRPPVPRHGPDDTRTRRDVLLVLAGMAGMVAGAVLLVDATRHLAHAERNQTVLGLTVIGFATGFELVALAWSSARRGMADALLAGVLGSVAYNSTMTLGAAALARPLHLRAAGSLHLPLVLMLVALAAVVALGWRGTAPRRAGLALLTGYAVFVVTVAVVVSGPR